MTSLLFNRKTCWGLSIICLLWIVSTGCEKEVNINLNAGAPKLVVEGGIETGTPPIVILTRSIGFFSRIDLSTLENAFVHNAEVFVSDGIRSVKLREYPLDTGSVGNKFYIYTVDTADPSAFTFTGQVGKDYKLNINYDGKTYESTTRIPVSKGLDSVWAEKPKTTPDKVPDARLVYFKYSDPDTFGNYVKAYTQRNSDPFYAAPGATYNDDIVNGGPITSSIFAGYNPAYTPDADSFGYFFKGDTVTLRWCAVDRNVYNFWNTFEFAIGTIGNPFATPTQVASNISNGALGVWAGYGALYYTVIIRN